MADIRDLHLQPIEGHVVLLHNVDDCIICMKETVINFRAHGDLILTPCGHLYHFSCISEWETSGSAMANTCPLCRAPLDPSFEDIIFDRVEIFPLYIPDGHPVRLN